MTDEELRLECVRLAVPLTGAAETDRVIGVVQIATRLYNHIKGSPEVADALPEKSPDRTLHIRRGK